MSGLSAKSDEGYMEGGPANTDRQRVREPYGTIQMGITFRFDSIGQLKMTC